MTKRRSGRIQRRASEQGLSQPLTSTRSISWRYAAIGGGLLLALAIIIAMFAAVSGPNPFAGTPQPDDGRGHVPACQPGNYSSVPATSGCHQPTPAEWGVYEEPADQTQLIHNLEHGGIVIWYQRDHLRADQLAELADFVDTQLRGPRYKIILSPWGGTDLDHHPIAVTAWRQLLYLDTVDLAAIGDFIDANYGKAPEPQSGPGRPA